MTRKNTYPRPSREHPLAHFRGPLATGLAGCLALWAALPATAQTLGSSPFDQPQFLAPTAPRSIAPLQDLSFRRLAEIALPGPLPGSGPSLDNGRIRIPVAGALAVTGLEIGAKPELHPAVPAEPNVADAWVESADGRVRFRAVAEGRIEAERRCRRCKRGWKRLWKLRVPGSTVSPPVVTDGRIYFGALDNVVYAVRRTNGHRAWATPVDGRIRESLVLWRAPAPSDEVTEPGSGRSGPPDEAVLALPGDGAEIVALGTATGRRLASFKLPAGGGRLVGRPLVDPMGRIIVAMQKYRDEEAALLILELTGEAGGDLPYNGPSLPPQPSTPTGGASTAGTPGGSR